MAPFGGGLPWPMAGDSSGCYRPMTVHGQGEQRVRHRHRWFLAGGGCATVHSHGGKPGWSR
jgi:hypothetical protein